VRKVHTRKYRHARHAVSVKGRYLYATDNYRHVRVKNTLHRKGMKTYRSHPFADHKSVGRGGGKARYAFKGVDTGRKFHRKNAGRTKHASMAATGKGGSKSIDRRVKNTDRRRENAEGIGRLAHVKTRKQVEKASVVNRKNPEGRARDKTIRPHRKSSSLDVKSRKGDRSSRKRRIEPPANKRKSVKNPKGSVAGKARMEPITKKQPSRAESQSHRRTLKRESTHERSRSTINHKSKHHTVRKGAKGVPQKSQGWSRFQRSKSHGTGGGASYSRGTPRSRMLQPRSQSRGGSLSRRR
jgi:hypothetical protein